MRKIHEEVEYFEPNRSRLESLPATKNHQGFGTIGDSEDESDAKIFSVPDSETGQQSVPYIQLELMPRQPQQAHGNADRVKNKFGRDVCHMEIKIFRSIFTTAMCKCTIRTLLDDSNLNALQTFRPRLNILRLVDFPYSVHVFEMKNNCCLFERIFKVQLNGVIFFGI